MSNNKDRESGFYWVKFEGDDEHFIAEWDGENEWWNIPGDECGCISEDFEEIDEERIVRKPKN